MSKFCGKCGTPLDPVTHKCPKCDAEEVRERPNVTDNIYKNENEQDQDHISERLNDKEEKQISKKQQKADIKLEKKLRKKAKWRALPKGKKIKKTMLKFLIFSLLGLFVVSGIAVALQYFNIVDVPFVSLLLKKTETKGEVKKFDNGDVIFNPGDDQLSFDAETSAIYYKNLLIVYTASQLEDNSAKELANSVNGNIVGNIKGCINVLQIKVDAQDLNKLNSLSDTLMKSDKVLWAGYDFPVEAQNCAVDGNKTKSPSADTNPWSYEGTDNDVNENNPQGNNWWAEAIGAYTAWEYCDANNDKCKPVKVGVIDSGFKMDHEDLTGKIKLLPNFPLNTPTDHGTLVTGIIAANNNSVGLRGIADKSSLLCVDYTPSEDKNLLDTDSMLFVEITKELIESGAKVINNSWGNTFYSEEGFRKYFYDAKNDGFIIGMRKFYRQNVELSAMKEADLYDAYVNNINLISQRTAVQYMVMISQLIISKKEDFLIVQGAGNGYDNCYEKGIDAKFSCYYCGINEELYDKYLSSLAKIGISYADIANHKMIVGAVGKRGTNGNYYMKDGSNYGDNVDICAPGEDIFSCANDNPTFAFFWEKKKPYYKTAPGTSMATPMVSGSAALIWSMNPSLSAGKVKEILLTGKVCDAYGVGSDDGHTYPMLNVGEAALRLKFNKEANKNQTSGNSKRTVRALLLSGYEENIKNMKIFQNSTQYVSEALKKAGVLKSNIFLHSLTDVSSDGVVKSSELVKQLEIAFEQSRDNDLSIVYYEGHSFYYYDGSHKPVFETDSQEVLTFQQFYDLLSSHIKGDVLLIYDGCFAGELTRLENTNSRIKVLAACSADQESQEADLNDIELLNNKGFFKEKNECSILAYALYKSLAEHMQTIDTDKNGKIQYSELYKYICPSVFSICDSLQAARSEISRKAYEHQTVEAFPANGDNTVLFDTLGNSENKESENTQSSPSNDRNVVMTLDVSGSMAGKSLDETKKAANKFVDTITSTGTATGLVTYESKANTLANFANDKTQLKNVINSIKAGGSTNMEDGLKFAYTMLKSTNSKKKIIVLMSDGEPNEGKEGDALITYANQIKQDGIIIYTLGFFQSMGGSKTTAQTLMEKIASDGCHYEVANADDLVFFFGDVADQIAGQKYIYVRIACPVDVSVTYNGKTLNSDNKALSTRTDFGTLSFEDNSEKNNKSSTSSDSANDQIKVLRLKEGTDYDIKVHGNGYGMMNYTVGLMDADGKYSDFRKFENIKITKQTVVDSVASTAESTVVNVDNDGDGKYDISYSAGKNEIGVEVKHNYFIIIIICVMEFLIIAFIITLIYYYKKRRRS